MPGHVTVTRTSPLEPGERLSMVMMARGDGEVGPAPDMDKCTCPLTRWTGEGHGTTATKPASGTRLSVGACDVVQ